MVDQRSQRPRCLPPLRIVQVVPGERRAELLEGRIQPGRVFDRVITLDGVPDGYRAMNEREAIKVMITF